MRPRRPLTLPGQKEEHAAVARLGDDQAHVVRRVVVGQHDVHSCAVGSSGRGGGRDIEEPWPNESGAGSRGAQRRSVFTVRLPVLPSTPNRVTTAASPAAPRMSGCTAGSSSCRMESPKGPASGQQREPERGAARTSCRRVSSRVAHCEVTRRTPTRLCFFPSGGGMFPPSPVALTTPLALIVHVLPVSVSRTVAPDAAPVLGS
jgi:hypothetical protein